MAKYLKSDAVGIDKVINQLQDWLYDSLTTTYGWSGYECYGRARLQKNPRVEDRNVFEYPLNGKDYLQMGMDDKVMATSFFHRKELSHDEVTGATVVLFFNINLKKLLNQSSSRLDEDAIMDVLNVLSVNPPNFKVGIIKQGTEDVYSEYNVLAQDRDNYSDFVVFSIELTGTFLHKYC